MQVYQSRGGQMPHVLPYPCTHAGCSALQFCLLHGLHTLCHGAHINPAPIMKSSQTLCPVWAPGL